MLKKLILLVATILLLIPFATYAKEDKQLSFQECEDFVKEITTAQDNLRTFIKNHDFNIDLTNATPEEKEFFINNLKIVLKRREFVEKCYTYYELTDDMLDKPLEGMRIINQSPICKSRITSNLSYLPYLNFDPLFFDLRGKLGADIRYLAVVSISDAWCDKGKEKFYKDYIKGEKGKLNFCYIYPQGKIVLVGTGLFFPESIVVTCPRYNLEKEFKAPLNELQKISLTFPEIMVVKETKESKGIFNLIFTGKYTHTYQFESVKLDEKTTTTYKDIKRLLSALFYNEEILDWFKRELGMRGFLPIK